MVDLKQMNQMSVLYTLPGMDEVPVLRDMVYKTVDEEDLKFNVYHPVDLRPNENCATFCGKGWAG